MSVRPIKRHRLNGGYYPLASDTELDKAFGPNRKDLESTPGLPAEFTMQGGPHATSQDHGRRPQGRRNQLGAHFRSRHAAH